MKKTPEELWRESRDLRERRKAGNGLLGNENYQLKTIDQSGNKVNIQSHYVDKGDDPSDDGRPVVLGGY